MAGIAEDLRAAVAAAQGPEEGAVIRWQEVKGAAEAFLEDVQPLTLTYAALYVNGHWYITGRQANQAPVKHNDLMARLADKRVVQVDAVETWGPVK